MIPLVVRWVLPLSLLAGVSLWLEGYASVGDGFSAGAVAGVGAVMQYAAVPHDEAARRVGAGWSWRLVAGGLLLVLAVAIAPVLAGIAPVTHAPAPGGHVPRIGIVELHTALALDLGVAACVYGAFVGTADRLFPAGKEIES